MDDQTEEVQGKKQESQGHTEQESHSGESSEYLRELARIPLVKKLLGEDLFAAGKRFLVASGFISALFTRAYANPIPFGVVMIFLGGYAIGLAIHRAKGRFTRGLVLPTLVALLGIATLVFADGIRSILIDHVSSFSMTTYKWSPRHHLMEETQKLAGKRRHSYPTSTVVVNNTLWKEQDPQDISLIPDALLRNTTHLTFLTGPARSGKEFIAREWASVLARQADLDKNARFAYVFFIDAENMPKEEQEDPKWPRILSHAYKAVVDSEAYYEMVLRYRPSLIIVANLERVGRNLGREKSLPVADSLVRSALELTQETNEVSVLISTRPDELQALKSYGREYSGSTKIKLQTLENETPNDEYKHLKLYLSSESFQSISQENKEKVSDLVNDQIKGEIFRSLFSNNSFLREIAAHVDEYKARNPMQICDQLLANYSAFKDYEQMLNEEQATMESDRALEAVYELALDGSVKNRPHFGFYANNSRVLLLSGLVDLKNDTEDYVFSPKILQSYFAVKGLQRHLTDRHPESISCSKTLNDDIANMEPLDKKLRELIQAGVRNHVIIVSQESGKECR
jgi:hypothetical protein